VSKKSLVSLLQRPDIWQASRLNQHATGIDTGFQQLNQTLYLGGWPQGGVVEILPDRLGGAELLLLLPCLARLSQQPGWLVLIAPPYIPYAPAWQQQGVALQRLLVVQPRNLSDLLWCTEQALRSTGNSVISWLANPAIRYAELRKLQLLSQQTTGLAALIRPAPSATQNSPATLRVRLHSHSAHLALDILKQPGGWAGQNLLLPLSQQMIQEQVSANQLPVYRASAAARYGVAAQPLTAATATGFTAGTISSSRTRHPH